MLIESRVLAFQLPFYHSFIKLMPLSILNILLLIKNRFNPDSKISYIFHARDFIGINAEKSRNVIYLLLKYYQPISSIEFVKEK